MSAERRTLYWLAGLALFLAGLYVLRDVLLPFVVGMVLAYLLDPIADWLEAHGSPRWLAATLITLAALLALVAALMLVVPLLHKQIVDFGAELPRYMDMLRAHALSVLEMLQARLTPAELADLRQKIGAFAGPDAVAWAGKVLKSVWGGGVALFNLLSLVVITPIVTFYLLRDWDRMVATVDGWLPRRGGGTVREQAWRIDEALSGFIRGQSSVCFALGAFYAVGLTIVGVQFGLVIGVIAGLISFIPYLGASIGLVLGVGVALAQYGLAAEPAMAVGVFLVGQTLESYVLTPRWVGDKTGLHPVWLMFALMAGGALAGFTGLLVAVPVAAAVRVLALFAIERYKQSVLFEDDGTGDGAA
jgi:predicted PurR-regulated permease PerM